MGKAANSLEPCKAMGPKLQPGFSAPTPQTEPKILIVVFCCIKSLNGCFAYCGRLLGARQVAAAYLQVALDEYQKEGEAKALLLALRYIAEAQGGVSELSRKTHLNRESLYNTISSKGNPRLQTLSVLFKTLGFCLLVTPN